jgi:uncharacterized membrane protein
MKNSFIKTLRHGISLISSLFLSGLFAILPLAITVGLFYTMFNFIMRWIEPLHNTIVPEVLRDVRYSEFIFVLIFILALGALLRFFLARSIVHAFEKLLSKIPLIRPIYSGLKQLTSAFSMQDKQSFKQVVLVEFPRKGVYSIGFLTSEFHQTLSPDKSIKFFNVFIPTTPNPTSGFFIVVPEAELITSELTRQEAMTLVISGGIIQPERFLGK